MRVATPSYQIRVPGLLASTLLLAWTSLPATSAQAEPQALPSDRQRLEAPPEKPKETDGFELPAPTAPADTSDAAGGPDPMAGWNSNDPQITRREDRLLLTASTYGFAGAFAGFSVWALVASTSRPTPQGKQDWRKVAGVLASIAGGALVLGTVLWVTAPKARNEVPATSLAIEFHLAPGGASARLQLRFF